MFILQSIARRLRFGADNVLPLFYEEAQVARYLTVGGSEGNFLLPKELLNDNEILSILAPGLHDEKSAVLSYRTTHTGNPRFIGSFNNHSFVNHTLSQDGPNTWHHVLPPRVLKPGDNQLIFAVFPTGTVTFSDIVILYTAKELTVTVRRPDQVLDPG